MLSRSGNEKPLVGELSDIGVTARPEQQYNRDASVTDGSTGAAGGSAIQAPQKLSEEARRKLAEGEAQFALNLMRVISVLVRSPLYKHYSLSDLEWLVLPPLRLGQCAILNAETPGLPVAAAVALWASVSPEVDARLSQDLQAPIRLRPDEWRSGEILWLVDVVGSAEAVRQLLDKLKNDRLKDQPVKLRSVNPAGLIVATELA